MKGLKDNNFDSGDMMFLHKTIKNPKTGKPFHYNTIVYALTGISKNKFIEAMALEWKKRKEEFKEYATKLAS